MWKRISPAEQYGGPFQLLQISSRHRTERLGKYARPLRICNRNDRDEADQAEGLRVQDDVQVHVES